MMDNERNYKRELPAKDEMGRTTPQAPELEKVVLGALLIEQSAYQRVGDTLRPHHFYVPANRLVYEAIERLIADNRPVDILTATEQLRKMGKLEEVGGAVYVTLLSSAVATSAFIEQHAQIILQKYLARELATISAEIHASVYDSTKDVDDLMQEAEARLFKLSQDCQRRDYRHVSLVLGEAVDRINAAIEGKHGVGVPAGFSDLDNITGGWQKSDLVIIAARPAMGKTALALSIAKNAAYDCQVPTAIFSLEMSDVQLVDRLISNICTIQAEHLRTGNFTDEERFCLTERMQYLANAPLYIDDTPSLSVFELRSKARRLVREHGVQLIIVDYLQLMTAASKSSRSRQEEVSAISRALKGLAKELYLPVIALSQVSRKSAERGEQGESKPPQLSDLRESGAIEQDADMVLFIHRPEYYGVLEDSTGRDMRGKAELIIAKHRNGAVGSVVLNFEGKYTRFETSIPAAWQ